MIPGRNVINMSQQEQLMRMQQQQQQQQQQAQQQVRPNMMPQQQQQQVYAQQGAGQQYVGGPQGIVITSNANMRPVNQGVNQMINTGGGQQMVNPQGQMGATGAMTRGPQQIHVINQAPPGSQYGVGAGQAPIGSNNMQSMPHMQTNEDEEYNRKRDEMRRLYLPKLERMYQQASSMSGNSSETAKTKAVIDVLMGIKKVQMDVLLKCEQSLSRQQQQQPQQQSQPVVNQQQGAGMPQRGGVQVMNLQQQQFPQAQGQGQVVPQPGAQMIRPAGPTNPVMGQVYSQQQQQPQVSSQPQIQPMRTNPGMVQAQGQYIPSPQQQPPAQSPQAPNTIISTSSVPPPPMHQTTQIKLPPAQPTTIVNIPNVASATTTGPGPYQTNLVVGPNNPQSIGQPGQIKQQPMVPTGAVKMEVVPPVQPQVAAPAVSAVPPQPQQLVQPTVVQTQQPAQKPNPLHKLLMSIEACNSANPVHKNNIRYLLDSIKTCIDGPQIKISQVDSELIKSSLEEEGANLYAKKMPNFVTKDGKLMSSVMNQLATSPSEHNFQIPTRLLIELASLPDHKFKIELKSRSQTLTLPVVDDDSTGNEIKTPNLIDPNSPTYPPQSDDHSLEKNYIILTCLIVSKSVALVPPIRILLPYTYPDANPLVDCIQLYDSEDDMIPGYNSLGILRRVNKQFQINYWRLPERFSVTQVLDAWYSSVESLQNTSIVDLST